MFILHLLLLLRIKEVFDECASLQRHFIDTFATSHAFLGSMLLELKESLLLVNGVDELRKGFVLNPVDQGDQMGAFARKAVSIIFIFRAFFLIKIIPYNHPLAQRYIYCVRLHGNHGRVHSLSGLRGVRLCGLSRSALRRTRAGGAACRHLSQSTRDHPQRYRELCIFVLFVVCFDCLSKYSR